MTLSTAGSQFYPGPPFLLLVKVMKRQMIGKLMMILLYYKFKLWGLTKYLILKSCSYTSRLISS